jgi:LPS-assembly lipoprotein
MSSSNSRNLRFACLAAGLGALFALTSCQVKPLYATDSGTQQALASIDFSEADDRVELEVRNNLVFLAGGGASEPTDPEYDVDFNVTTRYIGVLLDLKDDLPRAGRVELRSDFTLKRHGTGEILKTGKRRTVALVDYPDQEFAKIRATRDAENRAARELAELMRADIASWLGR